MGASDIPIADYVDLKQEPCSVTHWGQFKLLLGEIEFLTPYIHIPDLVVVYAGSSPGHHLKALVELMPNTWVWKLYDARPCEVYYSCGDALLEKVCGTTSVLFGDGATLTTPDVEERIRDIQTRVKALESANYTDASKLATLKNTIVVKRETNPSVHVYTCNLTMDIAFHLRQCHVKRPQTASDPQLLLISDIRTPFNRISEHSVCRDMDAQLQLTRELGPYQASLKFKLPYSPGFSSGVKYFDGSLRYQPFSPRISHEARLVAGPDFDTMITYNIAEYAKRMFHYQTVLRTSLYRTHEAVADLERHPHLVGNKIAIDHCYDCTSARTIAAAFLGTGEGALDLLEKLASQVASVQLACKGGGMLDE